MEKPARKALGPRVGLFDVAALALAFPLAVASYDGLAERPWVPSMDALVPGIALAIVLWGLSALIHHLYDAHRRHSSFPLARSLRAFTTAAAVLVVIAATAKQRALSPLLTGLYLAFALALLVGARLGWRAVATVSRRGSGARRYDSGRQGAEETSARTSRPLAVRRAELDRASWGEPAAIRRDADVASAARGAALAAVPAPAVEGPAEPARLLDAIRSRMDEVSYTPGNPNVLSMTKYLHDVRAEAAAASPAGAAPASRLADDDAAASFSRADRGDESRIAIGGVLDAVSAMDVRPAFDALVAERRRSITVDLSSLRLIDSAGVGLIVSLFKRCKAFGGNVEVSGMKDQPLAIFRMLRLERVLGPQ